MRKDLFKGIALGAVISTITLMAGSAVAATGFPFILGKKNTASRQTYLKSTNVTGSTLKLANLSTAPALGLNVAPGVPPMTVNSGTVVPSLNSDMVDGLHAGEIDADKVDGLHANELGRLGYSSFVFPATTPSTVVASANVTTTRPHELILAQSSFYVYNFAEAAPSYPCEGRFGLRIDTVEDGGSLEWARLESPPLAWMYNRFAISNVLSVTPGVHTVDLYFFGNDFGTCTWQVGRGFVLAQTMPFTGDGTPAAKPQQGEPTGGTSGIIPGEAKQ